MPNCKRLQSLYLVLVVILILVLDSLAVPNLAPMS